MAGAYHTAYGAVGTSWTNSGLGNWFVADNWDGFGVSATPPDATTYTIIGNGGGAQIASGNAAASTLSLGPGSLHMSGGTLSVGTLRVNSGGLFQIDNAAVGVTVSDSLSIYDGGQFAATAGATVHMTGSQFDNQSTTAGDLGGLGHVTFVFEGGIATLDNFEVGGQDFGPTPAGLSDNFALGGLTLGGANAGNLQLVDFNDNQPGWAGSEALYVGSLSVGDGSTLDLNGLTLYYQSGTIDPGATILLNGGSLVLLPEPGTCAWLAAAALALLWSRQRRRGPQAGR